MKKILLFLFSSSSAFAQTNVYHPFPDSNAVWNVQWSCFFGFGDSWFSYRMEGDTSIGNNVYHKIVKGSVVSTGTCGIGGLNYQGCIRQDTSLKKVFIVTPFDSVEKVFLDFNLQIGDTVFPSGWWCTSTVQNIDSILIGNSYRKRWWIDFGPEIIEGIGSTWGLMEPPCPIIDFPATALTCFQQDGRTLYPDTISSCEFIDAVINKNYEKNILMISPNPFQQTTTLTLNNISAGKNLVLTIYNSLGMAVRTETIPSAPFILDRKFLSNGLYFFSLESKESNYVGKGKFLLY